MTKILITNAWSWYNKGDAAIVITMADALRKYIPAAEICILSHTTEIDRLKYKKYGIKVLEGLRFPKSNKRWRVAKGLDMFSRLCRHSLWAISYRFLNKDIKYLKGEEVKILEEYANADIIISCGGEVIWGGSLYIFFNLYEIFLGKLLGKPVVIYSQSLGPFRGVISKILAKFFLNKADLITLREEISLRYLQMIGVNKLSIFITADSAFLLQPILPQKSKELLMKEGINLQKTHVGITLRHWIFPNSINPEAKFKAYITEISKIVDFLIEKLNSTVIFFPQVMVPNSEFEDDKIVAQEVFKGVTHKESFKILVKDYAPEELKGMIGQMDLFIGTRMHSNIFSTSMCVPTVAIGYRHKTEGIMKTLGLEEYVCNINNLKFKDVSKKIKEAWINKEKIKENLKTEIKNMRHQALYNAELVKNLLEKIYENKKR